MRNLAIFGAREDRSSGAAAPAALQSVTIDRVPVRCGVVRTRAMEFDPRVDGNRDSVLVRTVAFSCNYRDKGFAYTMSGIPAHRFFTVGSEFVGEVVETGADVVGFQPGDRVIPNHEYTGAFEFTGVREGVVSNRSSKEYQVVPASRLVQVPATMPTEVAAAFSINAQTAYSMVRRVEPRPGAKVLVTSARSNTSLFLIAALRKYPVTIFASTSSARFSERLTDLGVDRLIPLSGGGKAFSESEEVDQLAAEIGGFDHVLDPMYDAHLEKAVRIMAPFGTYITCGLVGQNANSQNASGLDRHLDMHSVMGFCLARNLSIIGNCIGLRADLDQALADYEEQRFRVVVDSVFRGEDAAAFLDRTFNSLERFGKVVFHYD